MQHRTRTFLLLTVAFVVVSLVAFAITYVMIAKAPSAANAQAKQQLSDVLSPVEEGRPFYLMLVGTDSRENTVENVGDNQGKRADIMMLARIDSSQKQVTLVTIPRDIACEAPGSRFQKLNEVLNVSGAAGLVRTTSDLLSIPIAHYLEVDFSGAEAFVDALGGIWVNVPQAVSEIDPYTQQEIALEAGSQPLSGKQAVALARSREKYEANQDAVRQSIVRQLTASAIDSFASKPLAEMPGIATNLLGFLSTDLSAADAVGLATGFLESSNDDVRVYSCTLPFRGSVDAETGLWTIPQNTDAYRAIMSVVDAGGDPGMYDFSYDNQGAARLL